jgi:hypothetical protein
MSAAVIWPDRGVARSARSLTHPRVRSRDVLAVALRSGHLTAALSLGTR